MEPKTWSSICKIVLKHTEIADLVNIDHSIPICDACHESKQTRNSFTHHSKRVAKAFALLHIDVYGPYKEISISEVLYFLNIMDDFTRYMWTYIMQHNS